MPPPTLLTYTRRERQIEEGRKVTGKKGARIHSMKPLLLRTVPDSPALSLRAHNRGCSSMGSFWASTRPRSAGETVRLKQVS
ncbi:centriole, cilia and spindle-associated protein [Platysternon megacephalum]|uniref:Centriole, cilia and spindle-associated protein n=1 Tax=Platysternon megacephalum TaxID=55544 RepID=A0A4D9ESL4_9SAUR|nr:centriole, cilia and spindle-associated protein [Platysternon megacephalum]